MATSQGHTGRGGPLNVGGVPVPTKPRTIRQRPRNAHKAPPYPRVGVITTAQAV